MAEKKKPKTRHEEDLPRRRQRDAKKVIKQVIKELTRAEGIIDAIGDGFTILDRTFKVLYENQVHRDMLGEHVGENCYKAYQRKAGVCGGCPVALTFKDGNVHTMQMELQTDKGTRYFEITASPLRDSTKKIIAGIEVVREITDRKRAEEALKEREKELRIEAHNLEEANIALKVLLKRREEDKTELEDNVLLNIKGLVTPYIERLKMSGLDERQKNYVSILESNLTEVVSQFSHRLSSNFSNFTPTEIQVANLLKQGKTNKEIGELLNSSARTIAFHRDNIRKKLGLKKKKTNLKSFLLSLK